MCENSFGRVKTDSTEEAIIHLIGYNNHIPTIVNSGFKKMDDGTYSRILNGYDG